MYLCNIGLIHHWFRRYMLSTAKKLRGHRCSGIRAKTNVFNTPSVWGHICNIPLWENCEPYWNMRVPRTLMARIGLIIFYHRCGLCDIHPYSQHRCDQLNEYVSSQLCFTQKWFQSRCFISPIGKGKSLYRIGANQSVIMRLHNGWS